MTEEEIAALQEVNKSLTERVNQLESINVSLVDQKKELKLKLEDGLTDEEAKTEINNLKALLEVSDSEKSELIDGHSQQINGMRMKDALRDAGVLAQNDDAMSAISSLVLDGSSYDDGFLYKNEDGSTKYNEANKPYGIIDKVNELKEGNKSYLFAPIKGGGGSENHAPIAETTKTDINSIINAGLTY